MTTIERVVRFWCASTGARAFVIALVATLLVWGVCLSSQATLSPAAQITTISPFCRVSGPKLACKMSYSPITMEDPAATNWQNMPEDYYFEHARDRGEARPEWDPYRGSGYPIALDGLHSPFSIPQWFQSHVPGDQGRDLVAFARFLFWTFGITWLVAMWGASVVLLCGVALVAALAPYGAIYTDIVFLDVDLLSPWFFVILTGLITQRITLKAAAVHGACLGLFVGSLAFQQSQLVWCAAIVLMSLTAAPCTRGRSILIAGVAAIGVISVVPAWLPLARNFGEFISSRSIMCIAQEGAGWEPFWKNLITPQLIKDRMVFMTLVGGVTALFAPVRARYVAGAWLAMSVWEVAGLPELICHLPVISGLRFSRHLVVHLQMLFIAAVGIAIAGCARGLARRSSWIMLGVAQVGAIFVLHGVPASLAADWVMRASVAGAGFALLAAWLHAPGGARYRQAAARWSFEASLMLASLTPLVFASTLPLRLLETRLASPELPPLPATIDPTTPLGQVQKLSREQDRRHYSPTGFIYPNWGEALGIMELLSVHAFYPLAYHELNAGLFTQWERDPFHGLVPDRFVAVRPWAAMSPEFQRVMAVHRVSLLTFGIGTASFAPAPSPYSEGSCQLLARSVEQRTESYLCPDIGGVGFFPKRVVRASSRAEVLATLTSLSASEIAETAVLGPELDAATRAALTPAEGRVLSFKRGSNQLEYELDVQKPGVFAIADTYFPGWKAFVNEQRVGISRANVNFKAVHVPRGHCRLRLQFSPRIFGSD